MADRPTIDAYNKIAEDFHARNKDAMYGEQYQLFASYLKPDASIIDIGCGTGRDAEVLIRLGFPYTGVDASKSMLAIARERIAGGVFRVGDFYHLDFPDNAFDGFWAAASFLHVPKKDIDAVLRETQRVTKPGGVGFVSLKKKTHLDEGYIKEEKAGGIERYFAFYEDDEFKEILKRNGFNELLSVTMREKDGTYWLCYIVRSGKL